MANAAGEPARNRKLKGAERDQYMAATDALSRGITYNLTQLRADFDLLMYYVERLIQS